MRSPRHYLDLSFECFLLLLRQINYDDDGDDDDDDDDDDDKFYFGTEIGYLEEEGLLLKCHFYYRS